MALNLKPLNGTQNPKLVEKIMHGGPVEPAPAPQPSEVGREEPQPLGRHAQTPPVGRDAEREARWTAAALRALGICEVPEGIPAEAVLEANMELVLRLSMRVLAAVNDDLNYVLLICTPTGDEEMVFHTVSLGSTFDTQDMTFRALATAALRAERNGMQTRLMRTPKAEGQPPCGA